MDCLVRERGRVKVPCGLPLRLEPGNTIVPAVLPLLYSCIRAGEHNG